VVALPHPFVTLSLARSGPKTEQKTKTAHKTVEAVYDEEFQFVVPSARTARVRQRDKYDLRAGDGLLLVDVKDQRGYTPLRKAAVLGCARLDLYDLFGPRGRWIRCRAADGSMAGRRLEHTCVVVRRRADEEPAGPSQPPKDASAGENGLIDQAGSGLKKMARAVSPNPKPRPFGDTRSSASVPRWEADDDYDDEWETGEVALTMVFTPNENNVSLKGDERPALA